MANFIAAKPSIHWLIVAKRDNSRQALNDGVWRLCLTHDAHDPFALQKTLLPRFEISYHVGVSDRKMLTRFAVCNRIFYALALLTVLSFYCVSADQTGFDDPVATLSENDNLDEMIRGGYRFDNIELVVHRATMGAIKTDKAYGRRKQQMQELKTLWGAYMFVRAEDPNHVQNALAQAMHFLTEVSKYKADVDDRV